MEKVLNYQVMAWVIPTLLFIAFIQLFALPTFGEIKKTNEEIQKKGKNVYSSPWLDSVKTFHSQNIQKLNLHLEKIKSRISPEDSSVSFLDQVRRTCTKKGLKVLKVYQKSKMEGQLLQRTVWIEGMAKYQNLMSLFQNINEENPNFYFEKISIKPNKRNTQFIIALSKYSEEKKVN